MRIKLGLQPPPAFLLPPPAHNGSGPEALGARQQELINRLWRMRQATEIRHRNKRDKRRSPRDIEEDLPDNDFERALVDAYDRLTRR